MMQYLTKALLAACWFMLLTFPVMGIKLNSVDQTVEWQFDRVILLGVASSSFPCSGTGVSAARPAASR